MENDTELLPKWSMVWSTGLFYFTLFPCGLVIPAMPISERMFHPQMYIYCSIKNKFCPHFSSPILPPVGKAS